MLSYRRLVVCALRFGVDKEILTRQQSFLSRRWAAMHHFLMMETQPDIGDSSGKTEQEAGGRTPWDAARPRLDVPSDSEY